MTNTISYDQTQVLIYVDETDGPVPVSELGGTWAEARTACLESGLLSLAWDDEACESVAVLTPAGCAALS